MADFDTSILDDVKKTLGLASDYNVFDQEIIIFINTALSTLTQLGLGPDTGYLITDKEAKWSDFIGTERSYAAVQSYVYLRVRLLFDPPTVGYVLTSMEKQLEEMTWRVNAQREYIVHPLPPPDLPDPDDEVLILDGGRP